MNNCRHCTVMTEHYMDYSGEVNLLIGIYAKNFDFPASIHTIHGRISAQDASYAR
jgi:hypothetical protein